jgi:hypothetical protein
VRRWAPLRRCSAEISRSCGTALHVNDIWPHWLGARALASARRPRAGALGRAAAPKQPECGRRWRRPSSCAAGVLPTARSHLAHSPVPSFAALRLHAGPNATVGARRYNNKMLSRFARRAGRRAVSTTPAAAAAASAGAPGPRSIELMGLEDKYGAHNYHPVPVVLSRAKGASAASPSRAARGRAAPLPGTPQETCLALQRADRRDPGQAYCPCCAGAARQERHVSPPPPPPSIHRALSAALLPPPCRH